MSDLLFVMNIRCQFSLILILSSILPQLQAADLYKKSGNVPAEIVKLSTEEEAAILKQVKVPAEFGVSVFSSWQAANYPVYVAASPGGDLYVASDGNGSLGRDPGRGRVLRLRDTDKDGRADEVTEFIKDIDSPRGLIWDHDRLYVLHPPHISVHFDKDHDGVAEESQRLIEGIAFGFKDRPADHTTNGIDIGIDGWIYIAGGDFGFMKAKGTDGRELQLRGGGVIRFRADGSGLEIFATGTRNILGTPISPLLDIFARDNTNDGGGWDVRFHHFSGLEDHGYPRLYKNFAEEHIHPLADYGGGSGCGSVYISEPGIPEKWNNAPMTCDWGTGALWKHDVARYGAGFEEVTPPEKFISLPRPTDADVDGMSAIYQASWKGRATFRWEGADTGFIVRVMPKEYTPKPLPDFGKLSDTELIGVLAATESQVRRIATQRSLLRRAETPAMIDGLLALVKDTSKPLPGRVAALYALTQRAVTAEAGDETVKRVLLTQLDQPMLPFVYRALGDLGMHRVTKGEHGAVPGEIFNEGIISEDPRTVLEAIVSAARQNCAESAGAIAQQLGHSDPVIAHTAFRALAKLKAAEACFAVLDNTNSGREKCEGASFALMRIHRPEVVEVAIARLQKEDGPEIRKNLLSILCRLYYREAEWKGNSWGTRPDTRGPYYEPVTWEASEKILSTLKSVLTSAPAEEVAYLVKEMNRNRIQSNEALTKIISMAVEDDSLIPDAVGQLVSAESIPAEGVPLLLKAAASSESSPATLSQSIIALSKTDHADALQSMFTALVSLDKAKGSGKEQTAGREAFINAPKLENHHLAIEKLAAENLGTPENIYANVGLLALASRTKGSPESREMSNQALDLAWKNPSHKLVLLKAVDQKYKTHYLDKRILVAMSDPDPRVAKAAEKTAKRLRLQMPGEDTTPKIATLSPGDAMKKVIATKGDVALGESVFARAICHTCHTVNQSEKQKGPYLGNIASTYNRQQLAEAILIPGKTIAQGFKTNVITLKDGTTYMGFVTDEAGDTVTLRDIASNETTLAKSDVAKRETLPTSMMPPGLVNNFSVKEVASLLDYLKDLAKK
ncbi:MAG: c-type cytochrome [Verrucomicrobiales bacterium]|nr:c-type cytochrome [Verrucomicrobiales bacterium]